LLLGIAQPEELDSSDQVLRVSERFHWMGGGTDVLDFPQLSIGFDSNITNGRSVAGFFN
jgi:hypothetical protein